MLGLVTNVFNLFSNISLSYSMWPMVLTAYNLPPWLCMKDLYFMLTLLIPGSQAPGKDLNVFLRPLIDELKDLWVAGVKTWDAIDNSVFTMCVALLWTDNDFPARSSRFGWRGQSYKAYLTCNEDAPSLHIRDKNVFFDHRRFLPMTHPMRQNRKFNGKAEKRPPRRRWTTEDILR